MTDFHTMDSHCKPLIEVVYRHRACGTILPSQNGQVGGKEELMSMWAQIIVNEYKVSAEVNFSRGGQLVQFGRTSDHSGEQTRDSPHFSIVGREGLRCRCDNLIGFR